MKSKFIVISGFLIIVSLYLAQGENFWNEDIYTYGNSWKI